MKITISIDGTIRHIYSEGIDLSGIGQVTLSRASHVEPQSDGWYADLSPVDGPTLGPFPLSQRSAALAAEAAWIEGHAL